MARAEVTVRNKVYSVACAAGQESRLEALGVELDRRVDQIAGAVGDVGEQRLFLIAALALLDELDAAHQGMQDLESPEIDRAADALDRATQRIDALTRRLEDDL
ncbi:MAG: cell division protein ZapA [Pseudomonadota bacterium]